MSNCKFVSFIFPRGYSGSILCLLLFVFYGCICFGQKTNGKLAGKVTDGRTTQPLSSVSITAKGITKGTQSITDGTYIFTLPAGTYTISYSYTGFQQKDIQEVQIRAGETNYLDIVLETRQLESVVVTSTVRRESQSTIYNRQKTSAAASDGISIELIRKTPDANAGQIMKRVTGVNVQDNRFVVVRGLADQYNQTMMNGVLMSSTESNRNAFALDLVPAAVIDNITVNKTATPDMPGNFAGGIVQINTKDFPANDFISVELGTGFSDKTLGKNFYSDERDDLEILGFGGSIRDLPKDFPKSTNRLGDISLLNPSLQQMYLRMLKNNLAPINYGPSKPNESVQLGYGKTIRFKNETQLGIVFALSQRKAEIIEQEITARDPQLQGLVGSVSKPVVTGLRYYSENTRYRYRSDFGGALNVAYSFGRNKITFKNLVTQILNNTFAERPIIRATEGRFPALGDFPAYGVTYFTEQKRIINSILSGEHRTGNNNETRIDWNVNTTINNTNIPDSRNFVFTVKDTIARILESNQNQSTAELALQQNGRVWAVDKDYIYGGAFNVTTPFTIFKGKQLFKGGLLFQNRIRKTNSTIIIYSGLYGKLDSVLSPSNMYSPIAGARLSGFSGISSSTGTFNAGSSLLAIYESLENRIGEKLRIIWGVRAENYQQYVNVYDPVYYANFRDYDLAINGLAARTTFNFLPSVNVVYAHTRKINFRAAYSNTVVRPELKDLAAFPRYDYLTFIISEGNAGLRSTSIQNYDLKFELFPSAGEIISISAFYKKILDPIEYARLDRGSGVYISPLNTGNAYVKGIEAEIRKKMDFIPSIPWLKNITVFGNGSLLESKVKAQKLNDFNFPSIAEHGLSGQPDYIINAGLTISAFNNSFEVTTSYNRTGDYIFQLGSADRDFRIGNGDLIFDIPISRVNPRDLLDLVISQSLFKNKCRIKANVSNLLNSRYIVYQDVNSNGKIDDPITIKINVSDPSAAYIGGTDNRSISINAQRTYSFTISYTF